MIVKEDDASYRRQHPDHFHKESALISRHVTKALRQIASLRRVEFIVFSLQN